MPTQPVGNPRQLFTLELIGESLIDPERPWSCEQRTLFCLDLDYTPDFLDDYGCFGLLNVLITKENL